MANRKQLISNICAWVYSRTISQIFNAVLQYNISKIPSQNFLRCLTYGRCAWCKVNRKFEDHYIRDMMSKRST